MTKSALDTLTDDQLAEEFARVSLEQSDALEIDNSDAYNALMRVIIRIRELLRARGTEAQRVLVRLLNHKNAQVRLSAAKALLVVEPELARASLELLSASGPYPQRGDAGMSLSFLDDGTYNSR